MKPFVYREYDEQAAERNGFFTQRVEYPFRPFMWHYHDDHYEIISMLGAEGQCWVGDYRGAFRPGEIYVIAPGLPHSFFHLDGRGGRRGRGAVGNGQLSVRFHGELFAGLEPLLPQIKSLAGLLAAARRGVVFAPGQPPGGEALLSRLTAAENDGRMASLRLFLELLEHLAGGSGRELAGPDYRPPGRGFDGERVSRACQYLHAHFREPVSLAEVARAAGGSVSNLCAFFRKATGRTVIDYVNELRVDHAGRHLRETDRPILEIALESGYPTLSHFNRQFKKLTGVSPRQYRRGEDAEQSPAGDVVLKSSTRQALLPANKRPSLSTAPRK